MAFFLFLRDKSVQINHILLIEITQNTSEEVVSASHFVSLIQVFLSFPRSTPQLKKDCFPCHGWPINRSKTADDSQSHCPKKPRRADLCGGSWKLHFWN